MPPGVITSAELIRTGEGEDGYHLQFRVWPAKGLPVATLVLVHGMMSHSGWFRELARMLAALQINVVGADRRGSGLNQRDRGDAPSRQILLSDLRRVMDHEESGIPLYLAGWCWGAVLAVNAALEFGSKFKGLVLLAPGLIPSARIKRALQDDIEALQHAASPPHLLRSPVKDEMFTDIPQFRELIAQDVLAVREFTPRFIQVSRQMQLVAAARLAQLTHPVLLLLAALDQAVDNKTTLARFQKLRGAAVTSATLPCNHGMQFEAPQEITSNIKHWLAHQGVSVPLHRDAV
jgi:alpha-beta hydrolase superfamily lysophospholipase